jgi:hypothetical protein
LGKLDAGGLSVAEDGNSKGLWAGGYGEETLTPEQ